MPLGFFNESDGEYELHGTGIPLAYLLKNPNGIFFCFCFVSKLQGAVPCFVSLFPPLSQVFAFLTIHFFFFQPNLSATSCIPGTMDRVQGRGRGNPRGNPSRSGGRQFMGSGVQSHRRFDPVNLFFLIYLFIQYVYLFVLFCVLGFVI